MFSRPVILLNIVLFSVACSRPGQHDDPAIEPAGEEPQAPRAVESDRPPVLGATPIAIAKWKANRRAAFSVTYDMGNQEGEGAEKVMEIAESKGLRIDFELVTARLTPEKEEAITKKLIPRGFEIFGHGHEHINHDKLSAEDAYASFKTCFDTMRSIGLKPVAYAYPGGKARHAGELKRAGFLSGRVFDFSKHSEALIMPDDEVAPASWHRLPTLVMMDRRGDNSHIDRMIHDTEDLIPYLDEAVERRAWLTSTYHNIGSPEGFGWYDMDNFASDMEAIVSREFWVGSMNDVTLYAQERKDAVVVSRWQDGKIVLSVEDHLDDALYDEPLTLLVTIPEAWHGHEVALVDADGKDVLVEIREKGTTAMFDLPPDGREATLSVKLP